MAQLSLKSTIGITKESTPGTYVAPTVSDLLLAQDLRANIGNIEADLREFTGSIHRPGPSFVGETFEVTAKFNLRGPGGTSPPAANAFILGRILQSLGFTESITSTAIPVAPEALSGGTTTGATLGAGAAATADLYKGMMIHLAAMGANTGPGLEMIRSYSAAKAMVIGGLHSGALSNNYQILKQLAYIMSGGTPPTLSASVWIDGRRFNGSGLAPSSAVLNVPTASRDQTSEFPSLEVTLSGNVASVVDEAPPGFPTGLAIPAFKNGKFLINNTRIGGASLRVDFGTQVAYAPDPNQPSGNETAQLVETTRSIALDLNQVASTTLDLRALALAQTQHSIEAVWGSGVSGNIWGFIATDCRFQSPTPTDRGGIAAMTGNAYVDGVDKTLSLVIPFF